MSVPSSDEEVVEVHDFYPLFGNPHYCARCGFAEDKGPHQCQHEFGALGAVSGSHCIHCGAVLKGNRA